VTIKPDVPSALCGGAIGEGFGPVADFRSVRLRQEWCGGSRLISEISRPDLAAVSREDRHERNGGHRSVAHGRGGTGQGDQIRAGVQPGGDRRPPAADRGGEPSRSTPLSSSWPSRHSRLRRQPTAGPRKAAICRGCTVSPSPSKGASTWPARRPRRDSRRWRARTRSGCPHVERLKAAGAIPIGRTNLASFTVRWHCGSELWGETVNPWTGPAPRARPAAVTRRRWRPA
jgi:Amidase